MFEVQDTDIHSFSLSSLVFLVFREMGLRFREMELRFCHIRSYEVEIHYREMRSPQVGRPAELESAPEEREVWSRFLPLNHRLGEPGRQISRKTLAASCPKTSPTMNRHSPISVTANEVHNTAVNPV